MSVCKSAQTHQEAARLSRSAHIRKRPAAISDIGLIKSYRRTTMLIHLKIGKPENRERSPGLLKIIEILRIKNFNNSN